MSWQASQWAVKQRTGSGPGKAILLVIAEDARAQHDCGGAVGSLLSQDEIAERAEIAPRTVWAQMKALEAAGLINRRRRFNKHGHRVGDLILLAGDATGPIAADATRAVGLLASHDKPYSQLAPSLLAGDATQESGVTDKEPVEESPPLPFDAPSDVDEAFQAWNAIASELGLPCALELNASRSKALKDHLRKRGLTGWRQLLELMRHRPFMLGENDRGWRASLDWILKPANTLKVLEGAYTASHRASSPPGRRGFSATLQGAADIYGDDA